MEKLFGLVKNYIIVLKRRFKKLIIILPFIPKLQGSLSNRINYFRRYINPYINVLEEQYVNSNMNKSEIKRKIYLAIEEMCDNENELYMSRLVIVLGTKCSLRCRDCSNLIPYFQKPCDLNSEKIINSIERISRSTKQILRCELIGGEPLMANNFLEILEYLLSIESIKSIEVTTNGTIVPKNELTINILQNPKVYIRISNYGDLVNNNNFINFLIINNIRYEVLELDTWILPGNMNKRNKNKNTLRKEYARCTSGYLCKTLFEDKLFACARAASLYALGVLPVEYISIDDKCTTEELKKFILRDFSVACDYCDVANNNPKEIEPAIQL